jgi:hypothetical protein
MQPDNVVIFMVDSKSALLGQRHFFVIEGKAIFKMTAFLPKTNLNHEDSSSIFLRNIVIRIEDYM